MSKTWKWILGIVVVLVIIGAIFALGMAYRMRTLGVTPGRDTFERNWNGPMMGQAPNGWEHPRVMRRNDGWGHPMMCDQGFAPYHSGFFMLGGVVKLVLFFGLLYGAYWLGRRNARITLDPAPAAPVANPSAASQGESAIPSPEAESASATRKRTKKE